MQKSLTVHKNETLNFRQSLEIIILMKNLKVHIEIIYHVICNQLTRKQNIKLPLQCIDCKSMKEVIARTLPDVERSSQNIFDLQRPVSCYHGCVLPSTYHCPLYRQVGHCHFNRCNISKFTPISIYNPLPAVDLVKILGKEGSFTERCAPSWLCRLLLWWPQLCP